MEKTMNKYEEMDKLQDDIAYLSMPGLKLTVSELAELRWKTRRLAELKKELGVGYHYTDNKIGYIAGGRKRRNRSYIR